jgi:luciferase family oxidoreductase group 1
MPAGNTVPELWLLGSSDYSALLAAQLGTRFAFAHFISAHGGAEITRAYRERFRPSAQLTRPVSAVCIFVVCAPSRAQAERLVQSVDLRRLHMAKGIDAPIPTLEEAESYRLDARERAYVLEQRPRLVHGDPDEVRDKLLALKEDFTADELLVLSITGDYASRRMSYRLVAEAFEATAPEGAPTAKEG